MDEQLKKLYIRVLRDGYAIDGVIKEKEGYYVRLYKEGKPCEYACLKPVVEQKTRG